MTGPGQALSIVGIPGSLRKGSYNRALLEAAVELMPAGAELLVETIEGIPLYDGDAEAAGGVPPRVTALKDRVRSAAGLLIATPEYNNSLPGVLKNAIDWMSRPPADIKQVFGGKPVALIGATTGGFGTVLSQSAWLPVLRTLGTNPWFGARLHVSRAPTLVDGAGRIVDEAIRTQLQKFLAGFVEFVASSAQRRG